MIDRIDLSQAPSAMEVRAASWAAKPTPQVARVPKPRKPVEQVRQPIEAPPRPREALPAGRTVQLYEAAIDACKGAWADEPMPDVICELVDLGPPRAAPPVFPYFDHRSLAEVDR